MTGNGTLASPCVPENFSEFLNAIQNYDYISCPANAQWDLNETHPDGISGVIPWYSQKVDGNGITIKNLYFNNGYFAFYNTNTEISRIKIDVSTSAENVYCFYDAVSTKPRFFRNCEFTGLISSGTMFWLKHADSAFTHDGTKSCAFNLEFAGNAQFINSMMKGRFRYCDIEFSGTSNANISASKIGTAFEKCYVHGANPFNEFYAYGTDTVFDIEIPVGKIISAFSESTAKTCVINDSKMHGIYGESGEYILKASDENLHNAEYLQSIGFSIKV